MDNRSWERKEYSSWDEAFRALAPVIRQQSVRVAAYTQVLFVQACAMSFGADTPEGAERMKGENAELAYKCGMYHQIGKALVPKEYQVWSPSFTDEEKALYRKYTTDGRLLVTKLQEPSNRLFGKKAIEAGGETPTKKVSWLMLREACEQHMERFNGTGYPGGRVGNEISVIAQIIGLAKELDRLASETKTENPFDEACVALMEQAGKAYSNELIEVLKAARGKCRAVYKKYIHYTKTLPKTIPLVDKREERPMGLLYKPMVSGTNGKVNAYEAVPWFGGVLGSPDETESLKQLEDMFVRTNMVTDITMYLLYEATDTVLRMQNCKLQTEGVVIAVLDGLFQEENLIGKLEQLFADQPIDASKLKIAVSEEVVRTADVELRATLTECLDKGMCLVLDGYHPERLALQTIQDIGFTHLRFSPELYGNQETANHMTVLQNMGMTIIGSGADNHEIMTWLENSKVAYTSGTLSGVPVTEDELIRDMLASE